MTKSKGSLSVIIVPHSESSTRRITLSRRASRILIGGAILFSLAIVVFLADYVTMSFTRAKYRDLQRETQEQREMLAAYETQVTSLRATIDKMESYVKKLNVYAGLKDTEKITETGLGGGGDPAAEPASGPSEPVPPQQINLAQIQDLSRKADGLEKNLVTLNEYFEANAVLLASTPSIWPTVGWIVGGFGYRTDPFTLKRQFHYGIDIATSYGNPIVAPADGIVVETKVDRMTGRAVVISHGWGVTTHYFHLDKWLVRPGQKVRRGDTIGLVGKSGKATGPHVHYEVRVNDKAQNPMGFILEE
ncbi:MAG: peptidoglycan DD-metalloendopeptidase family protein [Candidatus Aminicenantes bacterium]|nr:peptidoglycan DD-metalloendopeptidase family protein [Candidatus Aminicenantes bacterium]